MAPVAVVDMEISGGRGSGGASLRRVSERTKAEHVMREIWTLGFVMSSARWDFRYVVRDCVKEDWGLRVRKPSTSSRGMVMSMCFREGDVIVGKESWSWSCWIVSRMLCVEVGDVRCRKYDSRVLLRKEDGSFNGETRVSKVVLR